MADSQKTDKLSVAIVGGGIGGLTLALGLLEYDHISIQVYEAAHSFGEIGAGLAIGPNTQRAIKLIGPHAWDALEKHATPNMWESYADNFMQHVVGKGKHEGEVFCRQKCPVQMQFVHRAHFLDDLVKGVPAERAHFNKRLQSLEDTDGSGVVLHFKDGTTAKADVVIGADGIRSATREFILGERDISAHSVFSGTVAYRGLVPLDKAVEKLGAEYAQNTMLLSGPGKAFLTYPINLGETFNIVVMDFEHPTWESPDKWILPATSAQLSSLFTGWGPTAQSLIALLDTPNLTMWAMRDDLPAATYTKGHVAMMGDAAHASTPFQGQGAGQAIEDSLVLKTLLGRVRDAKLIPNALAAYDLVRRPRSQKVVTTSREAGKLLGMMAEGVGDDLNKIRERTERRMHWIWNRDLQRQNEEAVVLFEESL